MAEYFFKTVEEKKKLRVVPVSGCGLDPKLKVSCPHSKRKYAGQILVASHVKLATSGKYYVARDAVELLTGTDSYKHYSEIIKKTAESGLADFIEEEIVGGLEEPAMEDKTTEKGPAPKSKKKTSTSKKTKAEPIPTEEPKPATLLESIVNDTTLVAPTSNKDGYYISDQDWALLVRNIKKHINTMIIGPTGSGKTSCVKEVCDRMGIKLHIFDMGSMIDPISSLLGVHRLENGESVFDYAKFTQCIQEPCVILLDELNRASLACNNVLFPCLDDRRSLSIEIASGKGVRDIKVHPEVTFIATANVGSEYTGTNSMDRALVNRFFPLELRYLPENEEASVLVKRTGIGKDKADGIVKVAKNIRSLFDKQEVSVSISIRETLMVANLLSDGWDMGKAMETIFLPLFEGTKNEGERSTIYKTITSY